MQEQPQAKQTAPTSPDTLPESKNSLVAGSASQKFQRPKNNKLLSSYCAAASLSFQMMAIMGTAYWVGLKLDQYFRPTLPIFSSLLAVGAIVLSIYVLISKATKM